MAKKTAKKGKKSAAAKRKSNSKRRNSAKPKRKSNSSKSMAKRKRSRRNSVTSGFRRTKAGIGSVFKKGMVGKVVMGIGAGTVAGIAINAIAPQFSGIAKPIAAFAAGGPVGGIAQVLLDGGLGNIGGLFGGAKQEVSV